MKVSSVKESGIFTRAYKKGTSDVQKHIAVYALKRRKRGEGSPSSLGLTVSKKYGCAVERSRARRILREAYRQLSANVASGYDIIVVARHSLLGKKTQDAFADMSVSFRKLGLIPNTDDI